MADRSAISRIDVDGGSVVFRQNPSVVVVLNALADFIFTQLLDGRPRQDLAAELSKSFPALPASDIDLCIEGGCRSLERLLADDKPSGTVGIQASPPFDDQAWRFDQLIKLGSNAMRLRIACDHFDDLMLAIYGPAIQGQTDGQAAESRLQVVAANEDYWLKRDDLGVTGPFNHHGAFLEMQQHLLSAAHAPRRTHLIMHASAVLDEDSGASIVLAGGSGSGKSSLTAAFLSRGYGFVTDDTAIIDADTEELWCLRLPLRLKEGTWQRVHPHVSESFDSWESIDEPSGRKIWRLYPKLDMSRRQSFAPPCGAVLFPVYEPNAATEISGIETLAALALMVEGGAWFETNEPAMADIVDWLSRTRCYSVIYSSAEDVVTAIQGQLRSDAASAV